MEQLYEVGNTEIVVKLDAGMGDLQVPVVHVLRQATTKEIKEYSRMSSKTEVRRGKVRFEGNALDAAEKLWNRTATRVEGYSNHGQPLMEQENWKELVPILHKETAVREAFGEVYARGDGDDGDDDREGEREA